jgi:hypothetical protein
MVTTTTLSRLAVTMVPIQQLLVFAFAFIQSDRPLSDADSLYALGRLGWLWQVGAGISGLGTIILALGLRRSLARGRRVRFAVSAMILGGVAVLGTGVFATDAPLDDGTVGYTQTGILHFVFGLVGLLTLLVVIFVLKGVFRRDPRWAQAASPTRWLAWWLATGVALLVFLPEGSTKSGVTQRLVFLPEVIWAVWVARQVGQLGESVESLETKPGITHPAAT